MSNAKGTDKVLAVTERVYPMDSESGQLILTVVRSTAIFSAAVTLVAILLRGGASSLLVAFAVANAATLLVVPIARGHYFMAMWPAAVWVPRWLMQSVPMRTYSQYYLWGLTQIPPILLMLHYVFERYTGPLGVLGIGVWLWQLIMLYAVVVMAARGGR